MYCEYQGQLLWKAVSSGEGRGEDTLNLTEEFEAEARAPSAVSDTVFESDLSTILCSSRVAAIASISENPRLNSVRVVSAIRRRCYDRGCTIGPKYFSRDGGFSTVEPLNVSCLDPTRFHNICSFDTFFRVSLGILDRAHSKQPISLLKVVTGQEV